jgi:hypothetical protein
MFGNSSRVAKVAGIGIRVDSSWTVVALLITYSLYLGSGSCSTTCLAAVRWCWPSWRRSCSAARSSPMRWPTPWSGEEGKPPPEREFRSTDALSERLSQPTTK